MSDPNSMKKLSDQELAQAAGGELDPKGGVGPATWVDEFGVLHHGNPPAASTAAGSANSDPANWTPPSKPDDDDHVE
jgi:hypothetical protein